MVGRFARVVVAGTAVAVSLLLLMCVALADHHGSETPLMSSAAGLSARALGDRADHGHGSSHENGRSIGDCPLADVAAAIGVPGAHGSWPILMVFALVALLGGFGLSGNVLVGFGIARSSRSQRSSARALTALCVSLR